MSKESRRESQRRYRERNKKKLSDYFAVYRLKNKERIRARDAEYKKSHMGEYRLQFVSWYKNNKNRHADTVVKWRVKNSERWKQYCKLFHSVSRRKVRKGVISADLIATLMSEQGLKCPYCWSDISTAYHVDHFIPIALNGQHADHNIQLLCPTCNLQKGKKHPHDFLTQISAHHFRQRHLIAGD